MLSDRSLEPNSANHCFLNVSMYSGLQKGMSIVSIIIFDSTEKISIFHLNPYIKTYHEHRLHTFCKWPYSIQK